MTRQEYIGQVVSFVHRAENAEDADAKAAHIRMAELMLAKVEAEPVADPGEEELILQRAKRTLSRLR